MDIKNCTLEVKDVTSDGIVTMYVSAFDNIDSDGDVMVKGAYEKTISERGPKGSNRIKQLWQHETWNPIGVPLEMEEDSMGLLVRSYISDIRGGDYRKMYKEGIITEHSVGFQTMKEDRMQDARYIKEVKLWEYSAVTWGANERTPVLAKSNDKETIQREANRRYKAISKALRDGTYTDDTMHLFEVEVKYLTDLIISLTEPEQKATQDEPKFSVEKFNEYLSN
jgi:HK97 family phage prohead protease